MSYQDKEEQPKKVWNFPANMANCADLYYTLQQKRYKAKHIMDAFAEEENALEDHIISKLPASKATGIAGKIARVSIVKKERVEVKDWTKVYAHILKTKDFGLMNRAINTKAVRERWAVGKKVPGTDKYTFKEVSVNKISKKGK